MMVGGLVTVSTAEGQSLAGFCRVIFGPSFSILQVGWVQ